MNQAPLSCLLGDGWLWTSWVASGGVSRATVAAVFQLLNVWIIAGSWKEPDWGGEGSQEGGGR